MSASIGRVAVVILIAVMMLAVYVLPVAELSADFVEWCRSNKLPGALTYTAFVVLATLLFLPGSVAIMIGGYIFGFGSGLLIAAIAFPLGAQISFEVARWLARPWVRQKIAHDRRMIAIEGALREEPLLIIFLTRLSLISSFALLNFVYGASSVRSTVHFVATATGLLPAIALYVYLGSLASNFGQILSGAASPPELGLWIVGAGILAIVAAAWVIHRAASKALERHLLNQESMG